MKRVRFQGESSEVRDAKYSVKVSKRRPSTLKIAKLGSQDVVLRYQNLNRDSLATGNHYLVWGDPAGIGTGVYVPMHIYNLSQIPNGGFTNHAGSAGIQCGWSNQTTLADRSTYNLSGINASGVITANLGWTPEVNGLINFDDVTKAMHKWTQIKMQLYGAMEDDTKFNISIMKFTDDFANLWNGSVTNPQGKALQDYLCHPYMSSRINPTVSRVGNQYIKVVKEWNVMVPRVADDIAQATPNQRELNIFMRYNWINDYNWPTAGTANSTTNLGLDLVANGGYGIDIQKHTVPMPNKSLFLVVRATCPALVNSADDQKKYSGTYNIMIRNCFTVPC